MIAYYNEIEPYPAQWLRNLASAGHIATGHVDERSIADVRATDLAGYEQCHFFAGIGVWSYALRLAGWPDTRPVWTGSCPCQPFSDAGLGLGTNDPRHLWPTWFGLIRECRPPTIFGEQVASSLGLAWLDLVCTDLESAGYAVAAFDLCAAGVGAPHIRQRLYFVAHAQGGDRGLSVQPGRPRQAGIEFVRSGEVGTLAHANGGHAGAEREQRSGEQRLQPRGGQPGALADSASGSVPLPVGGTQGRIWNGEVGRVGDISGRGRNGEQWRGHDEQLENTNERSPWSDLEWLPCRDGKARPTQPGLFPLAHGSPARVGRLCAYGNAIVPQVAAEVIRAYMEAEKEMIQ